ncbi:MAG: hypothetical protein GXP40_02590 [Chloroflexi bacterium]|nr:hypothetical protein [Chloroflexota bacterium]
MKRLLVLLGLLLSAACQPLTPLALGETTPASDTPAASAEATRLPDTPPADVPSTQPPCYFVWARQPLPELSGQVQQAVQSIQPQAAARAEAYGENCVDENGDIVYFAAKETDFYVTLEVDGLKDESALGERLEDVLTALEAFPSDETPGPQPGYISVTFQSAEEALRLRFTEIQVIEFRQQGLRGVDLFKALKNP